MKTGAAHEKRWATKAAQRCKNDSWWRLLHKRQRPKGLKPTKRTGEARSAKPKGETLEKGEAELIGLHGGI